MHDPAEKPPQLHLGHPGLRRAEVGADRGDALLARPGLVPRADEDDTGYVIHLPVRVDDLDAATVLARVLAERLGSLTEFDAGETTISTVDDQTNQLRVFCDLLLPDRSRCPQPYDHSGACGRLPGPSATEEAGPPGQGSP
ncbi:hypothetical protein [Melissospora conviva]|uniref:hypothetical protein n=1 Tax=Melissospora conviva TaxID=3388432 RepID=UPI003B815D42